MEARFPQKISEIEREEILKYLEDRFGIENFYFEKYEILRGVSNFWLFPKTPYLENLRNLQVQTVGLLFLRQVSKYLKPTSAFLQRFGYLAKKNIVSLSEEIISILKERNKVEIELDLEPGYVILKNKHWIIGCGLYLPGKLFSYLESKVLKNL
uniref:rRNA small subunit methyltransferase F RNA-binding PUA-like domain-containing protein n=1 Tax=Thermodesulfobacterium geofontis TaxID=1295609 RepID=A0A7V4JPG3_9BACT